MRRENPRFFMARATDPTLPGLLGRSSTTPTREKRSPTDMSQKIPRCVDVAVPLPVRGLFTYRVPDASTGSAQPGSRAIVPVGRRLVTGVIVAATSQTSLGPDRIKEIAELPDEAPVLPPDLLSLALWAARYYVSPPGGMIAATLPPGSGRRSETLVTRLHAPDGSGVRLRDEERRALEAIPIGPGVPARSVALSPQTLRRLQAAGLIRVDTILGA